MATPFTLTEEDIQSSANPDHGDINDEAMGKIPILKRRAATAAASAAGAPGGSVGDPICVIIVGMAGSGKTTLMSQLQNSLNLKARDGESGDGEDEGATVS